MTTARPGCGLRVSATKQWPSGLLTPRGIAALRLALERPLARLAVVALPTIAVRRSLAPSAVFAGPSGDRRSADPPSPAGRSAPRPVLRRPRLLRG